MKITRRQLKQIINEEMSVLNEVSAEDMFGGKWNSYDMDEKLDALAHIINYNHNFVNGFEDEYSLFPWKKLKALEDKVDDMQIVHSRRIQHHTHEDGEAEDLEDSGWSGEQIREAIDTKMSRAISKGNLPDARPDEKRASRRAERRFGKQQARAGFGDDYPSMSGLGPADDHLESITSQDMADAKRYAKSDLPRDQADYLDISVEDWYRIRQELDDHYEDRHMEDQMAFDDDPDLDDDGMLSVGELVKMTQNIADDVSENAMKITRKQLRQIINEELGIVFDQADSLIPVGKL